MLVLVDEPTETAIVWHGGATFNVHMWLVCEPPYPAMMGPELEAFTVYGDEGSAPSEEKALEVMRGWQREAHPER
jgi:hypothetical protein